jgi:hypothetical protein
VTSLNQDDVVEYIRVGGGMERMNARPGPLTITFNKEESYSARGELTAWGRSRH